jgi:transcriptional regulator GlxA family with amidase domain
MKRLGFVLFPGFQIVDLAAIPVFELANVETGQPLYEVVVLSENGGSIPSSAGVRVDSTAWSTFDVSGLDTVIIAGAIEVEPQSPGMLEFLRAAHAKVRRTGSICSGAFALAEAGILDGRRATTHWAHARELKRQFPAVRVEDDRIYIVDGNVWTSAGMTACIDLALAMVESDLGAELAKSIARKLVVYHKRAGGQSQFSALLELGPKTDRIQTALDYARRNLKRELSVAELAEAAHLSARQFSRAFSAETGQSPARAVENLRVEAARAMLESGRHTMEVVAQETGFGDPERMRRAFLRTFGQPPQAIRRGARAGVTASATSS